MALLQSRIHKKHSFRKFIFFLAGAAIILSVGLSIYAICRGRFSTVPLGRVVRPSPTEIISPIPSPSLIPPISPTTRMISYVHDGDTIYTRDFKPVIRLLGIDAPEMAGSYRCGADADCTDTTEECGAGEAKEKLKELVLNQEVVLAEDETVGATDKYNRWLRYVFLCLPSSTDYKLQTTDSSCPDLSLILLQSGLVRENGFGNSYEKQKIYQKAELEAKEKKSGIWGMCP